MKASLNVNGLRVPDRPRDRADGVVGAGEQVGGQGETPRAQVGDRRLADRRGEPPREAGPRQTDLAGQGRRASRAPRDGRGRGPARAPPRGRRRRAATAGRSSAVVAQCWTADTTRASSSRSSRLAWPGRLAVELVEQQADQRAVPLVAADHQPVGQRRQHPGADLADGRVVAHQQAVLAVGVVAPGAQAVGHRQVEARAVGRLAAVAREDHRDRLAAGQVADVVRRGAAHQQQVADARAAPAGRARG